MGFLSNKVDRSQLQPGILVEPDRVIHYTAARGFGSYSSVSAGKQRKKKNRCENCGHDPNVEGGVIKTCIDCFLKGHDLYKYQYGVSLAHFLYKNAGTCTTKQSDPVDIVISRATELLNNQGFGEYDLFENNCECFATFCKTHKPISWQAYAVTITMIVLVGITIL
ncbi:hypothetical protein AQUCO_05700069v1 [Aquilegia coerulea]|uniref:LRAT domain-containing protein n=1 Tax=Aquilegia coerulea TaxID=218851 RepID=A0A2G5CFP6_AQUCA|nr:hypothetical protein AQUCO_05700069v1 [Aquilegia coerulea]